MLLTTSKELILITGRCSYAIQIDIPYPDLLEKRAVSKKFNVLGLGKRVC